MGDRKMEDRKMEDRKMVDRFRMNIFPSSIFLSSIFLSSIFLSSIFLSAIFLSSIFLSAIFLSSIFLSAVSTLCQSIPRAFNFDLSVIPSEIGNVDLISVWNQKLSQPFRPFDHHDNIRLIQHLVQPELKNLARAAFNAIEIEMIHTDPPVELIHNRECRAVDVGGIDIKPRADALGEDRFTHSQIALKQKDRMFIDRFADTVSKLEGFFGGARDELSGWN